MSLLFDQNLSPKLVDNLKGVFVGTVHVRDVGLQAAADEDLWNYAKKNALAIVTKDSDFSERALLRGHPPKVIWIRRGNCSSKSIESLFRGKAATIQTFLGERQHSILILS